jgi:8-oxo-dGTP pyrophosphatase MutT (NUDIX family)
MQLPLPGRDAQYEMAASHRGQKNFKFTFNGEPKESSVMILMFRKNGDIIFPLIERAPYDGVHSGQMGLPGGKIEAHDENRIATALRETNEEIGVDVSGIDIMGTLSELYVQASNYHVVPVVGLLSFVPEYKPDPEEVSEVVECSLTELLDPANRMMKDLVIRGKYTIQAPYFNVKGKVVWGATAMILNELVTIIKEL